MTNPKNRTERKLYYVVLDRETKEVVGHEWEHLATGAKKSEWYHTSKSPLDEGNGVCLGMFSVCSNRKKRFEEGRPIMRVSTEELFK